MKQENESFTTEDNGAQIDSANYSLHPMKLLLIAGWIGLFTGLLEACFQVGWRQTYKGYRIFLSPHASWMAPVGEMLFFLFLGIVLAILVWRAPRIFTPRVIYFILALFSFLALLLLLPQLHIIVKWLLAAGLAVQTARIIGKYQNGFYQIIRSTGVWLVVLVILLTLGTFAWQTVKERRALAALPPAQTSTPNVILITLDTVRARSLSLYGYERKTTPELEKIAETSAVFDQAIAPSSWTFPSHASMFTGRTPIELDVGWTGSLDNTYRTLAEELGSRGYESAGFVANYLYCSSEIGIDRGMVHYEDYPVSFGQMLLSSSLWRGIALDTHIRKLINYDDTLNRKTAEMLNEDFLSWLSSREQNRPYFAFLNYFDAHEPIVPPAPFNKQFGPTHINTTMVSYLNGGMFSNYRDFSKEDIERFRNSYDSSIAYMDSQLGELFSKLSEKGMLDNTILIITSDHGELLGEKNLFSHGNSLYVPALRVPLIIRFPSKVPQGSRIQQPATLQDIPATVLDFLGDENQKVFPGNSLAKYFNNEEKQTPEQQMILSELVNSSWVEEWYPASKGEMSSIITERYHYILNGDGSEELYDRNADFDELNNLVQNTELREILEKFRNKLKNVPHHKEQLK